VADFLAMQLDELGTCEIKRDRDRDGAEHDAPLRRKIEARHDLREPLGRELGAELVYDGCQARALDREVEIADRRGVEIRLAETGHTDQSVRAGRNGAL